MTPRNTTKNIKNFQVKIPIDKDNFISINLLEYVTVIIMYAAATQAYRERVEVPHKYLIFKNKPYNMSAVVWSKKASMATPAGKALAKLFSFICINSPLGLHSAYLKGDDNIIADNISRMNTKILTHTSQQILNDFPELQKCRRFHPNQELLSSRYCAMLNRRVTTEKLPDSLGHFSPAKTTG